MNINLSAVVSGEVIRQPDKPRPKFGISSIGHCKRQLAYQWHGVSGIPLSARSKLIFSDGDRLHRHLRALIRRGLINTNSCYRLVEQERKVLLGIIPGHIDGLLRHHSSGCSDLSHTDELLEVKSMNSWRFEDFQKRGVIEPSYMAQASGYARAMGLQRIHFYAYCKDNGKDHELVVGVDDALLDDRLDACSEAMLSQEPELVDREYAPLKYGALPWQCGYCPFVLQCWEKEGVKEVAEHKYKICYSGSQAATKTDQMTQPTTENNGTEFALGKDTTDGTKTQD